MGYDISYHPVDERLICDRLVPYIMGGTPIDDLVISAVKREKVRFRAKSWALGLIKPENSRDPNASLDWLDSDLHIWGRPFLITGQEPQDVSEAIDRYLNAGEAEVDRLAVFAIECVAPGLHVEPDVEQGLPDDDELSRHVRWKMDLLRAAFADLESGDAVADPDGHEYDPRELLLYNMPLSVVEFAARFSPGWMDRGYVWPSLVLPEAGIQTNLFRSSAPLFQPIVAALPELADELQPTITENFRLGGYVKSAHVPALANLIDQQMNQLRRFAAKVWKDPDPISLRKWREAIFDAIRRGFGFLEASEVYSGPLGVMN